jgi:hypothetical protein
MSRLRLLRRHRPIPRRRWSQDLRRRRVGSKSLYKVNSRGTSCAVTPYGGHTPHALANLRFITLSCSPFRCGSASTHDEHSGNLRQFRGSCCRVGRPFIPSGFNRNTLFYIDRRHRMRRNEAGNTSPGIDDDCPSVRREWRRSRNDAANTSHEPRAISIIFSNHMITNII